MFSNKFKACYSKFGAADSASLNLPVHTCLEPIIWVMCTLYIIHVNILLQIILIDSFISESLLFSRELQGESMNVILQLQFWGKPSILP